MARQRMGEERLTDAEKQSRYRNKLKDEKQTRHKENIDYIRQVLHGLIDKMNENRLLMFCNALEQVNNLVSDDYLKSKLGISDGEFAKLKKQGVIVPERNELDPNAFWNTVTKYAFDNNSVQVAD